MNFELNNPKRHLISLSWAIFLIAYQLEHSCPTLSAASGLVFVLSFPCLIQEEEFNASIKKKMENYPNLFHFYSFACLIELLTKASDVTLLLLRSAPHTSECLVTTCSRLGQSSSCKPASFQSVYVQVTFHNDPRDLPHLVSAFDLVGAQLLCG